MVWGIDWGEEKTESQSLPLSTTSAPALLCVAFLSFPLSLSSPLEEGKEASSSSSGGELFHATSTHPALSPKTSS